MDRCYNEAGKNYRVKKSENEKLQKEIECVAVANDALQTANVSLLGQLKSKEDAVLSLKAEVLSGNRALLAFPPFGFDAPVAADADEMSRARGSSVGAAALCR